MTRLDSADCAHVPRPPHGAAGSEVVTHETTAESEPPAGPEGSGLLSWLGFGITPTSLPDVPQEDAC
jgi:hypothetical protein